MKVAAVTISILALLFTVFSFWWMNWRRGAIHLPRVLRSYSGCATGAKVLLDIPLVMFNSGAVPIVVENLRIRLRGSESNEERLFFNAVMLKLASDQGRAFARPFAVSGGGVTEFVAEFQSKGTSFEFREGEYWIAIDARVGHQDGWLELEDYRLVVQADDLKTLNSARIAHDNQARAESL